MILVSQVTEIVELYAAMKVPVEVRNLKDPEGFACVVAFGERELFKGSGKTANGACLALVNAFNSALHASPSTGEYSGHAGN
jgi:hypothetical protein